MATENKNAGNTGPERMKKEDMLDLEKGAENMDKMGGHVEGIGGRTISGAGAGPSTGETSSGLNRPGTEGVPAKNDYVDPEGVADTNPELGESPDRVQSDELPEGRMAEGEEASGFPGGGAVRTAEDRIQPGRSKEEESRFSPEEPLNRPRNPQTGG